MSDNRSHTWLDDAAAERLLHGDHDDPRAQALQRLLSAAATPATVDAQREEMAVAAFRAARDEGRTADMGRAAVRRRVDGWRRRGGAFRISRSVRALTGALVATAAIGGVAVAAATGTLPGAFGPFGDPTPATYPAVSQSPTPQAGKNRPERESPAGGANRGVPTPTAPATPTADSRPESLCRNWVVAVRRGRAMDARAYERLVSDAGGRKKVPGYCAGLLRGSGTTVPTSGETGKQRSEGDGDRDSQQPSGKHGKDDKSDKGDKGDSDGKDGKAKKDKKDKKAAKGKKAKRKNG
jgi:hypothetical protein